MLNLKKIKVKDFLTKKLYPNIQTNIYVKNYIIQTKIKTDFSYMNAFVVFINKNTKKTRKNQ